MDYSHSHLWINSRYVLIKDIIEKKAHGLSAFEHDTFNFIAAWFSGQDEFTLQTSGSTGQPKLITVKRDQMIASANQTAVALHLNKNERALIALSTKFIAGKMMLVRCFVSDMKIIAVDPCADPLDKIPVEETIHFTALVPYQVKTILESKHPHLLNHLLTVIIGGAALDANVTEKLHDFTCACYATYGMTETLSHVALQRLNGEQPWDHFKTLPGIKISTDARRCLVIQAPYLSEPIATNDIVEIIDYNKFKWLGRWDNIINTGGVKILPEKIESQIQAFFKHLKINSRFFIAGVPDPNLGNKVILVVEQQENLIPLRDKLFELMQTMQPHEKPWEMYVSPRFVLTETEKINRQESLKNVSLTFTIRK